jgi:hypothetical protein
MEDRLKFIYENSQVILKLLDENKITYSEVKKMIFNKDNSIKLKIDNYSCEVLNIDEQYFSSKELINLLIDNTFFAKRKEVLEEIQTLFYSYYFIKLGENSLNTKQLLLDKFIYLFDNSEVITDFIDMSNCNLTSYGFRIAELESLLLEYRFLSEDKNRAIIEKYKTVADNISSYDVIHKISLTEKLLDNLLIYIKTQKKDIENKRKKIKVIFRYYHLLKHIKNEVIVKNTYIDRDSKSNEERKVIDSKTKTLFSKSILKSNERSQYKQRLTNGSLILRDVDDIGVNNNSFISNNVLSEITVEDQKKILEFIAREKKFVKRIRYGNY